eukprot:6186830-Pleurochrysis_carterae.AAC.1
MLVSKGVLPSISLAHVSFSISRLESFQRLSLKSRERPLAFEPKVKKPGSTDAGIELVADLVKDSAQLPRGALGVESRAACLFLASFPAYALGCLRY